VPGQDQTYLFIDNEYLRRIYQQAIQSVFKRDGEVSYPQLKGQASAQRVFVYDCVDDAQRDGETEADYAARVDAQEAVFDRVRALYGFHVRLGSVRGKPKRLRQKEVDVSLATDMLTHGYDGNISKAVLLAGDLDFRPVVEALVRRGVFVEIWYEKTSSARELPAAADFGRELAFSDLYAWSTETFTKKYPLPLARHDQQNLPLDVVVLNQGVSASGQSRLMLSRRASSGAASLQMNDPTGAVTWFDYPNADVLQRYAEIMYGPIEWR